MSGRKRKTAASGDEFTEPRKKTRSARVSAHEKFTTTRVTRLMKVDSPRRAVFNTAELLEAIILQLPARSIYSAYRVCRQWRALVNTSTAVQQQLLVRLAVPVETWLLNHDRLRKNLSWSAAPIGTSPSQPDEFPWHSWSGPRHRCSLHQPEFFRPVKLHPLLALIPHGKPLSSLRVHQHGAERAKITFGKHASWLATSTPSQTSQSPSLSAHLTDPPCKFVQVIRGWKVERRKTKGRGEQIIRGRIQHIIRSESGITFRHIAASLGQPGTCLTSQPGIWAHGPKQAMSYWTTCCMGIGTKGMIGSGPSVTLKS